MLINLLYENPASFVIVALVLIISITIHEFAHAWAADRLGDPTPRYQDRITLNPLAHLDPIGTFAIFFFGFGWGKPVMFDPYNLKNPRKDTALIALAGPASNIVLAAILSSALHLFGSNFDILSQTLSSAIYFNIMLATFNMVPIAPLDGSKILSAILPRHLMLSYDLIMSRYSYLILIAVLFPWMGFSLISIVISPIIEFLFTLFLAPQVFLSYFTF